VIVPTSFSTTNSRNKSMGICERAKIELERAGWNTDSEKYVQGDPFTQSGIHILKAVEEFFKAGWSIGSVDFGADILQRLVKGMPLTPLTGEDAEWEDMSEPTGSPLFQNRRDSTVFKAADGRPFTVSARKFTYPETPEDADNDVDSSFHQYASEYISFPYMPQGPKVIALPYEHYDCDTDELGLILGDMAQRTKVRNLMRRKFLGMVQNQHPELQKQIDLRMSNWYVSKVDVLDDTLSVEVTSDKRGMYVMSDALTDELLKRVPTEQLVDILMAFKGTKSPTFATDCVSAPKS